jgi:lipoate-protein ligase B
MKISRRNIVSCGLTDREVQDFEQWGTKMDFNVNQALKACIAFTIQHKKPDVNREELQ